jgi:hypothetical protein
MAVFIFRLNAFPIILIPALTIFVENLQNEGGIEKEGHQGVEIQYKSWSIVKNYQKSIL